MKDAIGGYFELEIPQGAHYHKTAIRLNTARNCFEYILRTRAYKKVYIPYYTCDVMLEPIQRLGIGFQYYSIDENLSPILNHPCLQDIEDNRDVAFLYTNYFGLKQEEVRQLSGKIKNLIIDNVQAFYCEPISHTDTFYSARKFFGVPDGAYLYTDHILKNELCQDVSYEKMSHLLKRIDLSAEQGYVDFQTNDRALTGLPIRKMSKLTENLLASINYEQARHKRLENFNYLAKYLNRHNQLKLPEYIDCEVPMVYPFKINHHTLKQALIANKIFVATYWPNVFQWCTEDQLEYKLTRDIIPLPIDHRYGPKEMEIIIDVIKHTI